MNKVHFIGVGGIGMSALAQYYLAKGWQVSGSDLIKSEATDQLQHLGAEIFIGHRATHLQEKVDRVIYTAAAADDNPELDQARILGAETMSYAQALGELTRQYITLAVAGAHGKSTTTALLSLMLMGAGLDPTVIVGTRLREFNNNNFRFGRSRYLIIEADEYDRSFLNYYPTIAVITNIDREHLDTYGDLDGVIGGFVGYFNNVGAIGALVVNSQDSNTSEALRQWGMQRTVPESPQLVTYDLQRWPLKIPGSFNRLNAEAAWQAARILGVKKSAAVRAVADYRGSWRRFESLTPRRASLFPPTQKFLSDYAHHPAEIRATIAALKERYPRKKLTVIFQPHQLQRLNYLFDDFVTAFFGCDRLILMSAYQVAGREAAPQKDSKDLFDAVRSLKNAPTSHYLKNFAAVIRLMKQTPQPVTVFMGAGDIDNEVRRYFKSKLLQPV